MKSRLPALSLVLGGASSGKSAYAEKLVRSGGSPLHYIATMRHFDDPETRQKISRHKLARGEGWTTAEVPLDVARHVGTLGEGTALVDCATLWLANLQEAGGDPAAEAPALAEALERAPRPVVVVSNELGFGMVPMDAGARAFRDAHGRMNAALAARASLVVLVAAGLPLALKGTPP